MGGLMSVFWCCFCPDHALMDVSFFAGTGGLQLVLPGELSSLKGRQPGLWEVA